ncbi:tRNA (N6-threonylcarbamoyladenosine(37)-N6)-methyltransferase TrmO [Flavitalea sp. BT771]|uniref:tRNA (N6-threonylcarbamoyladenosine(37)-N6)-methyltransferase TrmO n=1 Tax=Flavitalea sp. BT771 TaxID=3063329 RepID=UPI0026E492A1|nr:tRNA (N6-threonylcarbamoyladenosine(37)-N6)-methyltransferase TrmO [Flavitalea sp. BT771]MDO6432068.1 tRNA (N6-threonylcarbamoyladenosine(37)-N6)-methyltransferase TrmO [Flavitalea sp. BT771]MDV6220977.1 tRNA (N6-threonylcarbamoyladenosine(37)-N6)-methyltransferase TrmO [Flavitalea sp. BT771]
MTTAGNYQLAPIGFIQSSVKKREDAAKQGYEGAPDVWLHVNGQAAAGLEGIFPGDEIILITWFHMSRRDVLAVHPRGDSNNPVTGVFATRSPDRPNPLGLHRVKVLEMKGTSLKVGPLEAIDGTPVVDIKPVLDRSEDG